MGTRSVALYQAVLSDLLDSVPNLPVGDGPIPPDASLEQFQGATLLKTLLKKWVPRDTRKPDQIAYEKFMASNKTCRDWKFLPEWESDRQLFGEFQREVDNFFHKDGLPRLESYYEVLSRSRVGPGAAIEAQGQSMYAKLFASPLTTTSELLYREYKDYVQWYRMWDDAETNRYSHFGHPTIVNCSKTSFVPKTADTSRMICVEPSLNMFFQLGLGRLMEEWLDESFGINLATQPDVNRRLARIGSYDGSVSTIDLSSASDSISLSLCKEVLPQWLHATLVELRSPFTLVNGERVRLEMVSTMGNGFTFPLQTILFSCIIRAAHRVAGIPVLDGAARNWSCFGDDLICDTRAFRCVMRLLKLAGFTPNPSKTFSEGPFRESCGTDWLSGQPVRGVYIKRLDSLQDLCVAVNLLNEWSAKTGIALKKACSLLIGWMRGRFLPVPFAEGNNTGVRVPRAFLRREHYRLDENYSTLYRIFSPRPMVIRVLETEICTPKGMKKLQFNSEGLLCSFLYGELVNGVYTVRHDRVYYHTRQVCTPFWDYAPTTDSLNRGEPEWQQWETAVLINLSNP
jgi:hypothetical protein